MSNMTDNTNFMRLVEEDVNLKADPVTVETADGEVVVEPVVKSKPRYDDQVAFAEDMMASAVAHIPALQYNPSFASGKNRFSKTMTHSALQKKRQKERRQRRRSRK